MINTDILNEIKCIQESEYAKKSDKQLISYEILSQLNRGRNKGIQPMAFKLFNENKKRKLSLESVLEIRKKYNPYVYGKKRLAEEYGVSVTAIYKILKGLIWKNKLLSS